MINFIKNHRVLSVVILLNIIAIIVVIILGINQTAKTATINIRVAPNDVTVTLNGKKYENNQSYDLKPGTYEAVISMDNMTTKTETLEISDGAFVRLHTYLLDQNNSFDYYKSHQDNFYLLEQIADESDTPAQEFIKDYNEIYSISNILPLSYANTFETNQTEVISIYIDLQTEICKQKSPCLVIMDATGKNHEKALSLIKEAGYNPDNYEIIFQKYGDHQNASN